MNLGLHSVNNKNCYEKVIEVCNKDAIQICKKSLAENKKKNAITKSLIEETT